jgi:transketolase
LVDAAKELAKENIAVNIVSMPCWEAFESQTDDYKVSVFPEGIPIISLEAMSTFGWSKYAHVNIGMTQFGASAPYMVTLPILRIGYLFLGHL